MRSIGAWKIKKLKKIVAEEMEKTRCILMFDSRVDVKANIKARLPEEWYDTWECAWSEIDRLINDFVNDYKYGRRS